MKYSIPIYFSLVIKMKLDLKDKALIEQVLEAIGIPKDRIKKIKYLPEILKRIMTQADAEIIDKIGPNGVTLKEAAEILQVSEGEAQKVFEEDLFKEKGLDC